MQGFGINIGKALRRFCKSVIGASVPPSSELHAACWMSNAYPQALKALMKIGLQQEMATLTSADIGVACEMPSI